MHNAEEGETVMTETERDRSRRKEAGRRDPFGKEQGSLPNACPGAPVRGCVFILVKTQFMSPHQPQPLNLHF